MVSNLPFTTKTTIPFNLIAIKRKFINTTNIIWVAGAIVEVEGSNPRPLQKIYFQLF